MHSSFSAHGGLSNHYSSSNNSRQHEINLNKYYIFDWGYPSSEIENAAGRFIYSISDTAVASPGRLLANRIDEHNNEHYMRNSADPDQPTDPPLSYKISFIKKRSTKDGTTMGPEALFSRHNTSIMMTRSMG